MYSLRIAGDGMREPHWHPVTAELGYVRTGRARMTVRSADGSVDTYELGAGDAYFIPRAFPHHIENLEDEETHFLVFFDQAEVRDIGYTGSAGSPPATDPGADARDGRRRAPAAAADAERPADRREAQPGRSLIR